MSNLRQQQILAAQKRVIRHLPEDRSFAPIPFEAEIPFGAEWDDGRLLFERHPYDAKLYRLTATGMWLKGIRSTER